MGYDLTRFVGEVDDEFMCSICTMVLEEPMQSQCDHLFCMECIKMWLLTDKSCPVDRGVLKFDDLKPAARFFRNLLEKFLIKCDFQAKGCAATVKLEHLQTHVMNCEYNPNFQIVCDKGCHIKMCRREYESNNCFKHFTDERLRQEDKIGKLNDEVTRQQEENTKLIEDLNRQQVQIIILHDKLRRVQEQIEEEPLKWRKNHNLKSGQQNILEIQDKSRISFAQSFYSLEPVKAFKIQILSWGIKSWIVIGLARKEHPGYDPPGWSEGSIGFCSNGTFQFNSKSEKAGVKWEDGDVLECGIAFPQHFYNNDGNYNVVVYFNRNSQLIMEKRLQMPVDGLFSTICMWDTKVKYIIN